ncbi:unnamed protein product [Caenorhabditis nigoni]
MVVPRLDKQDVKSSDSEKSSNEAEPTLYKKNQTPKTPVKRRREEKKEDKAAGEKRLEWLKEKAKDAVIPAESTSNLKPEHIFLESGPLIIHLCYNCRKANSTRPTTTVAEGFVQLPLGMCTVCRSHFNRQRSVKFFEHDLPVIKKQYGL